MIHRPVARGLTACEQSVIEEGTQNVTLVNCFHRLKMERVPSQPIRFVLHTVLEDGLGDGPLDVVITRLDNLEEIYRRSRLVRFGNRLQANRYLLRVRDLVFPVARQYQASLEADGQMIAQIKLFLVLQRRQP